MRSRNISKRGLVISLTLSVALAGLSTWLYFAVDETPRVGTRHAMDFNDTQVDLTGLTMDMEGGDPLAEAEPVWMKPAGDLDDSELALLDQPVVAEGQEVPEPSTLAILGAGGIGLLYRRRKRKKSGK